MVEHSEEFNYFKEQFFKDYPLKEDKVTINGIELIIKESNEGFVLVDNSNSFVSSIDILAIHCNPENDFYFAMLKTSKPSTKMFSQGFRIELRQNEFFISEEVLDHNDYRNACRMIKKHPLELIRDHYLITFPVY